jgi:DNA-binding beta-propeller fold protein YncE
VLLLVVVAAVLVSVGGSYGVPAGGSPVAFVAVAGSSQLVAVDLTSRRVVGRVGVPRGPLAVASVVVGFRPYVLVTSPPAGAVTLVDAVSRRVVKVFGGFGSPSAVEIQGSRAYVTDEARGQLVVIGLRSRRVLARVDVGARAHDVAVGDLAVVTHGPGVSYLTLAQVGNLGRPRTIRRVAAGGSPQEIAKQPAPANVYVSYWGSGIVGAIDWGRGRLLWRRRVGSAIRHVAFDVFSGSRLWATDAATGRAYLLSARNGRRLRTLAACPASAGQVALGGTAWVAVTCGTANALAVYSTRTWRRTLVPVGTGPHGVAVAVLP